MNILIAYIHAVNPIKGGTERVTWTVATALKKLGHTVYFLATHARPVDAHFSEHPDYTLIDAQASHEERRQKAIAACRRWHIDVVINECAEVGYASIFADKSLAGMKVISCIHFDIYGLVKYFNRPNPRTKIRRAVLSFLSFLGIQPYYLKYYRKYKKIFKEIVQVSDAVVLVTPVIAEQLRRFTGNKSARILSILNPLTIECEQPRYDAQAKEKMLLYVGRLTHTKNVDLLLKAWQKISAKYPEWKLEIAGDGPEKEYLHSLVAEYNIPRVHFHGQVRDLASLYSRAEYLLLPSDCESFSCVVLESMAYGAHPIVFDYPSAPIVIPNARLGTRVRRHTSQALARAISDAIDTGRNNSQEMENVAQHLSQFDIDKLVLQWQALLEQL